jgi:uncharacterized protein with ParB-like and HNH nuclease domain
MLMINANKDKLLSFFQGNIQFEVPFFQRAYVWGEENWATLWEHALTVLEDYEQRKPKEHFIGTIITKQKPAELLGESVNELIDGQQRVTTVALFLKAISDASNGQLVNLKNTINEHLQFKDPQGEYHPRIIHSDIDRAYFQAVLDGQPGNALLKEKHNIPEAYKFFLNKLTGYSDERLNLLRQVLLERVPVISMMLSAEDDEQEIFDTINALGVKLTTGQLLKNYIFKDKALHGLYEELWKKAYEDDEAQVKFWDEEKTAGRISRTNLEVMLYCFLVMRTRQEVRLESLFKEYRNWLKGKTSEAKIEFLKDLKGFADTYIKLPSGNEIIEIAFKENEKRFFQIIESLTITTIYPLVLYIYQNVLELEIRTKMLLILESYLVRRNICKLTPKNYNLLFIQIINKLDEIKIVAGKINYDGLASVISAYDAPTNLMPDDNALMNAFLNTGLSNQNAREILYIIALFQAGNGLADMPKLNLYNYSLEHLMPVKWQENWTAKEMTGEEKAERQRKLGTLGNFTLVTGRLNSKMQNSPWPKKKEYLRENSSLRMTVDILALENWDETTIDARSKTLAQLAIKIWRPI